VNILVENKKITKPKGQKVGKVYEEYAFIPEVQMDFNREYMLSEDHFHLLTNINS
jgi:hypothetical protein